MPVKRLYGRDPRKKAKLPKGIPRVGQLEIVTGRRRDEPWGLGNISFRQAHEAREQQGGDAPF
jgi:hypothetical protein